MVDVYLGALTAPSCKERPKEVGRLAHQKEGAPSRVLRHRVHDESEERTFCTPVHENA